MTTADSLTLYGLSPSDDSLPSIRALLAEEAAKEREGRAREDDLALLCCVQLFSRGHLEDVQVIWSAKRSGMDLGCMLDVQLLCGAGVEETKRFLAGDPWSGAAQALALIHDCEDAGEFADFSPAKQLEQYRKYFGVS